MTTIELVITISIIAIISSICFMKYENDSYKIESFARDENQKTLIFNRSFSYIIINNETNEVLLIGKVYNP